MKQGLSIGAAVVLMALVLWGGIYWSNNSTARDSYDYGENVNGDNQNNNQNSSNSNDKINGMHLITLKTSMGDVQFETYDADAPNTVKNFIDLANKNFYDNVIFHRIIKGFMVQGGDPTGTGGGGPGYKFADELDPNTPSAKQGYKKGVVAMANAGPDTNGSQFFIMLADYPLPHNYTIFGKVVKGQEVVDAMGNLPTSGSPTDRPLNPPSIKSVVVEGKQ